MLCAQLSPGSSHVTLRATRVLRHTSRLPSSPAPPPNARTPRGVTSIYTPRRSSLFPSLPSHRPRNLCPSLRTFLAFKTLTQALFQQHKELSSPEILSSLLHPELYCTDSFVRADLNRPTFVIFRLRHRSSFFNLDNPDTSLTSTPPQLYTTGAWAYT